MSRAFYVRVWPLPHWLDWRRLLGPGDWRVGASPGGALEVEAELERSAAADLAARLRGVGIGGARLCIQIEPPLHRGDLRRAQTAEARRHRERSVGFSKPGARLDEEGRLSLTPEALALQLGERARGLRVIDACAGAGGNAIGFARAGCKVIAVEIDNNRLSMARHNAALYGVAERIEFVCGDACVIVPGLEADLMFIDPPWGGNYDKTRVGLGDLPPCGQLLRRAPRVARCWLKVPPSFDPSTIPGCDVRAVYGAGRGDDRRVKFLLLEVPAGALTGTGSKQDV